MKLYWNQQDLYEVMKESGLAGVLKIEHELKMEMETNNQLNMEDLSAAQISIELIEKEIERKVTHTGSLYYLQSTDTSYPFIECFDLDMDFRTYLFTTLDLAEQYATKLLSDEYPVQVMEIFTGKNRAAVFESFMHCGVNFLIMNPGEHEYKMSINQLSDVFEYDGFLDLDHPLVNCRLNALMSHFAQDMAAKRHSPTMEYQIFELMKNGFFELPILVDGQVDRLDHQEIAFQHLLFPMEENGVQQLTCPVFTNDEALDHWAVDVMHLDDYNRIIVPFSGLLELAEDYNVKKFIFNWTTHNLSMTHEQVFKLLKEAN